MLVTPFSLFSSAQKIVLCKHIFVLVVSSRRSHANGSRSAITILSGSFLQPDVILGCSSYTPEVSNMWDLRLSQQ
jgi:hypothetical protein